MTRKDRARAYDIAADVITRPDIVPAALRFAQASEPSLGRQSFPELSPYPSVPELQPVSDEATVVDQGLRRITESRRRSSEAPPKSDTSVPRSGTRHRLVTTVPPPRRTGAKRKRVPSEGTELEASTTPREHVPTLKSPPPAPGIKLGRVISLVAACVIGSAVLGASLGSLSRSVNAPSESQASFAATVPAAPATARSAPVVPAEPPRVLQPEPERAPVVHFDDLPRERGADEKARPNGAARRRVVRRP